MGDLDCPKKIETIERQHYSMDQVSSLYQLPKEQKDFIGTISNSKEELLPDERITQCLKGVFICL